MIEYEISSVEGGKYHQITKSFQIPYGVNDNTYIGAGTKPNCNKLGSKKTQKEINRETVYGQSKGFFFGAKNSPEEQMSNPTIDKFKHVHFIFEKSIQRTIGGLIMAEMLSGSVIDLARFETIEVGSDESKMLMNRAADILAGEERNFCMTINTIAGNHIINSSFDDQLIFK